MHTNEVTGSGVGVTNNLERPSRPLWSTLGSMSELVLVARFSMSYAESIDDLDILVLISPYLFYLFV